MTTDRIADPPTASVAVGDVDAGSDDDDGYATDDELGEEVAVIVLSAVTVTGALDGFAASPHADAMPTVSPIIPIHAI